MMKLFIFIKIIAFLNAIGVAISACPYGGRSLQQMSLNLDTSLIAKLPSDDVHRALKPKPAHDSHVIAGPTESVSDKLNEHLREKYPARQLAECSSLSIEDLNVLLAKLVNTSHPAIGKIYDAKCEEGVTGCDKRSLRHKDVESFEREWRKELGYFRTSFRTLSSEQIRTAHPAYALLREGKCFEAVNIFIHQLTEVTRSALIEAGIVLPLLPAPRSRDDPIGNRRRLLDSTIEDPIIQRHLKQMEASGALNKIQKNYLKQSPCDLAHRERVAAPKHINGKQTFSKIGFKKGQIDSTEIPGAGYVNCDQEAMDQCTAGADVKYYLEAVVRKYTIPNSRNIQFNGDSHDHDITFTTRALEAIRDQPNSPFGEDKAGGDGSSGILGPALLVNPGQKMYVFVKNNLGPDTTAQGMNNEILGQQVAWDRINYVRNKTGHPTHIKFSKGIAGNNFTGPEFLNKRQAEKSGHIKHGKPMPSLEGKKDAALNADDLVVMDGQIANVPGYNTNGYDVFNLHMHGFEVAPHLFHPMGTSDPAADWVQIKPANRDHGKQQCYCYKFDLSDTQSRGDFLYHTHMHGTSSMLQWGGMFGMAYIGETNVTKAREENQAATKETGQLTQVPTRVSEPSLVHDLAAIADDNQLQFENKDVFPITVYDTNILYNDTLDTYVQGSFNTMNRNRPNQTNPDGSVSNVTKVVFVNQEYQPTFQARTNALSLMKVLCVSAGNLCSFQIVRDSDETIVPFFQVASDGISFENSIYRNSKGDFLHPDINANHSVPASQAYLSQGGGQRDAIAVFFEEPGSYTVYNEITAFDDDAGQNAAVDGRHILMRFDVIGESSASKTIKPRQMEAYQLASARKLISKNRRISEHRAVSFVTSYNQENYPFPFFGVGDINSKSAEETGTIYDYRNFDMGIKGGTCGIWTIRSPDTHAHPFHIHVNPFQVLEAGSEMDKIDEILSFYPDYTPPWTSSKGGQLITNVWRDTVMVPPFGYVKVKMCFDAGAPNMEETFAGKFVFHCHFLPHEDKGLMRNVIMKKGDKPNLADNEEP